MIIASEIHAVKALNVNFPVVSYLSKLCNIASKGAVTTLQIQSYKLIIYFRNTMLKCWNYSQCKSEKIHDDVIKWKHFPRNWPFVRGIRRSPVNFPHKGQWCVALMVSLICAWIKGWVSNRDAGDLRRHRAHYDVTVMYSISHDGK